MGKAAAAVGAAGGGGRACGQCWLGEAVAAVRHGRRGRGQNSTGAAERLVASEMRPLLRGSAVAVAQAAQTPMACSMPRLETCMAVNLVPASNPIASTTTTTITIRLLCFPASCLTPPPHCHHHHHHHRGPTTMLGPPRPWVWCSWPGRISLSTCPRCARCCRPRWPAGRRWRSSPAASAAWRSCCRPRRTP